HEAVSLQRFDDPRALRRWRNAGVRMQAKPDGATLTFVGAGEKSSRPSASFGRVQLLRRADASVLLDAGALDVPDLPNTSLNGFARGDIVPTLDWHHY